MSSILEFANVIRTKNSGPFEFTIDVMFKDLENYQKVKDSGVITKELIAELYNITLEKIVNFIWFDMANALKITIIRTRPSGRMGDRDVYGAQQHVPLLNIDFNF